MTGRELYGGLANTAYDSCYHLSCDNIYNINTVGFAQLARAAGYAAYKVRTHACSSSSSSESNCVALLATDESITRGCSSSKPRICLPTWLQALYNTLTLITILPVPYECTSSSHSFSRGLLFRCCRVLAAFARIRYINSQRN